MYKKVKQFIEISKEVMDSIFKSDSTQEVIKIPNSNWRICDLIMG